MVIKNMEGTLLTPLLFIQLFGEARKLSPPRFLTLRLHPDRYQDIFKFAIAPESIQVGTVPGPVGSFITKVNCIKPPMSVADGITIKQDPNFDENRLSFEIHGQPELVIEGLGYDVTPKVYTSAHKH